MSFDYFIDALILKRSSPDLFWNWTEKTMSQTLNPTRARIWYGRNVNKVLFQEWTAKFLGNNITKMIPVPKPELRDNIKTYQEVNKEFESYLWILSRSKTINDESYQFLVHFSKHFTLFLSPGTATDPENIFMIPKNEDQIALTKFGYSFQAEHPKTDEQIQSEQVTVSGSLKDYAHLTEEDKQFQNCLLTIKEVIDWYVDLRSHSVIVTEESGRKAIQYKMAEDVHIIIDHNKQSVVSIEQHQTVYSSRKTNNSWIIINDETNQEENYTTFSTYTINKLPDGTTEYYLRWAYTHILRKILNFLPQQWQYQFLLGEKKESWLAGCRRMGKSALAAYLIPRELFAMPNKEQFRNRPRKSLFIAPTKDKYKEVVDYFVEYTNKIRELKNLFYDKKLDRIVFEDQVIGLWKAIIRTPLAICDFSTSRGFEAGRGKAADWIGIEEAGYVDEWVFDNLIPIVEWEGSKLFCISTINADVPAQWFYRELTRAEEKMRNVVPWTPNDIFALRVTIEDIDDRVMTRAQKEATKERALLRWWSYYYAELFATVPSKNSVFDTNGFFIPIMDNKPSTIIIIAYDPGKRQDYAAITISGVVDNRLILFETIRYNWLDYHEQRDKVKLIIDRYSALGKNLFTVMDSTWVGEAVREIFRGLMWYHIWYSTRKQPAQLDQYGSWLVGKRDLVEMCQALIESKQLVATMDQEVLSNEMVNFTEFKTKQWNYTYEAKTGHDDVVNCMLTTSFIYGKIMGNNRNNLESAFQPAKSSLGYKPKNLSAKRPRYVLK